MPIATMRTADALFQVVRAYIPRPVKSDGEFDDWNVLAPAFIAIATALLEGILSATPPRGLTQAIVMSRSLAEYVVTFAWLAAATSEERPALIESLIKAEYLARDKTDAKFRDHISKIGRYKHLVEPNGPIPRRLIDSETTLESIRKYKSDASIPGLPDALTRAFAADQRWLDEFVEVRQHPFAWVYVSIFELSSAVSHPSITAVSKMSVRASDGHIMVGLPESLGASDTPYSFAIVSVLNMLLVASHALGWPEREHLNPVYNTFLR